MAKVSVNNKWKSFNVEYYANIKIPDAVSWWHGIVHLKKDETEYSDITFDALLEEIVYVCTPGVHAAIDGYYGKYVESLTTNTKV